MLGNSGFSCPRCGETVTEVFKAVPKMEKVDEEDEKNEGKIEETDKVAEK